MFSLGRAALPTPGRLRRALPGMFLATGVSLVEVKQVMIELYSRPGGNEIEGDSQTPCAWLSPLFFLQPGQSGGSDHLLLRVD